MIPIFHGFGAFPVTQSIADTISCDQHRSFAACSFRLSEMPARHSLFVELFADTYSAETPGRLDDGYAVPSGHDQERLVGGR